MSNLLNKSLLLENNKDTKSTRNISYNSQPISNNRVLTASSSKQLINTKDSDAKCLERENESYKDNEIHTSDSYEPLGIIEVPDYAKLARNAFIPQGSKIDPPEAVFQLMDVPIFTRKSISLLMAKAKAGKTTTAAWIIARAIEDKIKVVWIDTEQGRPYASKTQTWILSLVESDPSEYLKFYEIKLLDPGKRIGLVNHILFNDWPDILVIDGIRGLVYDINSALESTSISTKLMQWADIGNCHVLTILHQNKTNDEARGHVGTELVNKAETVIKVSADKDHRIIVEHAFARGRSFPTFALTRDKDGIPHFADGWKSQAKSKQKKALEPGDIERDLHIEVVKETFIGQSNYTYDQILEKIRTNFALKGIEFGISKSREFYTYYIDEKLINKNLTVRGYAKYESGLT